MNIVADARAVRSRIVGSENREGVTPPCGCVQHKRDNMRLRYVAFANFAVGVGPGRVEVTQCHPFQWESFGAVSQHALAYHLGRAVWIDRIACGPFLNRQYSWHAINGPTDRED